jgi:hypothetical protein
MGTKAGRWLRVSTTGQDEENQAPDIDAYCGQQGYEVTRTYKLHGKSATKGEQEAALAEAIEDIKAGVIDVIVAWDIDRFDRRGIGVAFASRLRVEDAGGRVEFVRAPSANDRSSGPAAWRASCPAASWSEPTAAAATCQRSSRPAARRVARRPHRSSARRRWRTRAAARTR